MAVKYVPIFESFYEVASGLDDERRLKLYDAVMEYGFYATWPTDIDDDEVLKVAFKLIKPNIDASVKRQTAGAESAAKRWSKESKQ